MKDLKLFLEGKTIEEVTVKDVKTKKKVDVVYYCYDKESLDKVTAQYEHVGKYWIDKYFYLARLKNKWYMALPPSPRPPPLLSLNGGTPRITE